MDKVELVYYMLQVRWYKMCWEMVFYGGGRIDLFLSYSSRTRFKKRFSGIFFAVTIALNLVGPIL
jgi:hypothetical protein